MEQPPERRRYKKSEAKKAKNKRKSQRNLFVSYRLSNVLAAIVGTPVAHRPWILKMLWRHIRRNNLQDMRDRRYIYPDQHLIPIFGYERFHGFKMAKMITPHLTRLIVKKDKEKMVGQVPAEAAVVQPPQL